MNLFFQPEIPQGKLELEPEESLHAIKVLRHKVGDIIHVTDGNGFHFECLITNATPKRCSLEITQKHFIAPPKHNIHIALAPTKSSDRTEWFIEKATEIGVQKISFIQTQHSERNKINVERARKTAITAIKQSGQVWLPQVSDVLSFKEALSISADQKFITHIDPSNNKSLFEVASKQSSYVVLIGPEGDFNESEIKLAHINGFESVNLGKNVLRTETAGVAACHILNLIQY